MTTKKKPFMKISKEVKDGMSKAKNAPARKYADNPKGKAPKPAKGLPTLGGGEKKLNAGAQKAKEVAATKAARPAKKRANSPRRAAVDAGLATKSEAVANAKSARGARRAVRRATGKGTQAVVKTGAAGGSSVLKGTLKAGGMAKRIAKKFPVATAAVAIGASMYATESGKASSTPKRASAPKRLMAKEASSVSKAKSQVTMATAKAKAPEYHPRPKGQVPSAYGSPTKPMNRMAKPEFSIPATPVKDLSTSTVSMPTGVTPRNKDKQIGGLLGRTGGKWHLGRKVGKG